MTCLARDNVGVALWREAHSNATSPLTTRRQTSKMGKKSKQEKQQKTPDPPPEEVPKEKEVAPGLLESDWIALVEREEDAEMVAEILNEVIDVTLATVQHSYIIEESYPYSVQWAKQHMLQTLECYFISHDPGESQSTASEWKEDDEPSAPLVDSWARGVVPQSTQSQPQSHTTSPVPDPALPTPSPPPAAGATQAPPLLTNSDSTSETPQINTASSSAEPRVIRRQRARPRGGRGEMVMINPPTQAHSTTPPLPSPLLQQQQLSSSGPEHKNTTTAAAANSSGGPGGVVKNMSRRARQHPLPSHSIRPHIRMAPSRPSPLPPIQHATARSNVHRQPPNTRTGANAASKHGATPSIPPLVDIISPQPGVTVRDGGRAITGQRSQLQWASSTELGLQQPLIVTSDTAAYKHTTNVS